MTGQSLAEQVRALATPTDVIKPDPQSKPGEDYPLQSAQEIESGMAYTGMDDVIRDLADKVRDRDETATTMERLAGEGYSIQIEFWWGAVEEVAWHCNLWEGRMGETVRPYSENEDITVPHGIVGAGKGDSPLQAMLKAEGSAKDTMTQQSVGMPGPGEPT
jgi:hypothetical protein